MAVHCSMIDRMDIEIGRVLDQLKAMNKFDDTLILFLSDNGASAEIMVRGDGHDAQVPSVRPIRLCAWAQVGRKPPTLRSVDTKRGSMKAASPPR